MEMHIQIKLQGEGFPSSEEALLRDAMEESLGGQTDMTIIDIGSGLGVIDIVLEVNNTESATKAIQQLLKKHQIEQATTVNIQKPKKAQRQVKAGDVFCVPLSEDTVAVGIVLHVSKVFKNAIMVGFYDQLFKSVEDVHVAALSSDFIDTPNYTGKLLITEGRWQVVTNSPELLARAKIPELVVVNTVYYKDRIVQQLSSLEESRRYPTLTGQGGIFVENKLRKHFESR